MKALLLAIVLGALVNVGLLAVQLGDDNFTLTASRFKVFRWGWPVRISYPLYIEEIKETWGSAAAKLTLNSTIIGFVAWGVVRIISKGLAGRSGRDIR